MKRARLIFMPVLLLCLLILCTAVASQNRDYGIFKRVLDGSEYVTVRYSSSYFLQSGSRKSLDEVMDSLSLENAIINSFALVDMDHDGANELCLECYGQNYDQDFLILHVSGGDVELYDYTAREFISLTIDGKFGFSSGIEDFGVAELNFNLSNGYQEIAYCTTETSDGQAEYYKANQRVSREEFYSTYDYYMNQPLAQWYSFSESNINSLLN